MELATYLNKQNLTDAEFGHQVGLSRSNVGRLKRGERNPSWPVMMRIKEATGGKVLPQDFHSAAAAE